MILNDDSDSVTADQPPRWPTLDELFRGALARRGDVPALADPPDRYRFTEGPPRRMSFAEVDCAVAALAARLKAVLPIDSVVGLQLPNTVESVVALLAVLRAGLIAAPLPLLWQRADAADALGRVGARGLITSGRVGLVNHADLATEVAAELFSIRFVGAFGHDLPDGVEPLDHVFSASPMLGDNLTRTIDPGEHVAVVTFETTIDGIMPVARSHAQLIAGGLAIALEGRIRPETGLLSALTSTSFAGLASTIVLWLINGGTLSLHHPFDADWLGTQCESEFCDAVVLPGPLLGRVAEAGLLGSQKTPKAIAVWRAPERFSGAPAAGLNDVTDVFAFGEFGIVPMRRTEGMPAPLLEGPVTMPGQPSLSLVEVARIAGTLNLRGLMVPRHAFPRGREFGPVATPTGFVDTGYPCRRGDDGRLVLDGPPPGLISIGGYRFSLNDLHEIVGKTGEDGMLAILPDSLAGYRLSGIAGDCATIRDALSKRGANSLIVNAFNPRLGIDASAA